MTAKVAGTYGPPLSQTDSLWQEVCHLRRELNESEAQGGRLLMEALENLTALQRLQEAAAEALNILRCDLRTHGISPYMNVVELRQKQEVVARLEKELEAPHA